MKRLFIVANLKSYDNLEEGKIWLDGFLRHKDMLQALENKDIIICPSYTLLPSFFSAFSGTNIKLGAQNLSPFGEGAYTGEVNAKQIKDFAKYVIVGHSERRKNFGETDDMLRQKVTLAKAQTLTPIYCVQDKATVVPEGVSLIAYEPIFAIGSGTPDTPENTEEVAKNFAQSNSAVLYGGSVTPENVQSFTKMEHVNGVLVGRASLYPDEFIKIIQNA